MNWTQAIAPPTMARKLCRQSGHHPIPSNLRPVDDSAIVIHEQDGVTVKTFRVNHAPAQPAVGYRIEYANKIVVISGDTVRTTSLLEQSRNNEV